MKKRFITWILVWAIVIPAVAGGVIMLLWNGLMPTLFGLATIGFWQAAGLFLLGQVLTGGFAVGLFLLGAGLHAVGAHHNRAFHERWKGMSAEERREAWRKVFRERMSRLGDSGQTDDNTGKATENDGNAQ